MLHEKLKKCICAAFFVNVGQNRENDKYVLLKGNDIAYIHPKSFPTTKISPPEWIVAVKLVRTSGKRDYVQTISGIKPEWIEEFSRDFYIKYKLAMV